MEHSGFIVLTLVSLVTASPYGYGAKSAAVAKAEASAGAFGALPVIPVDLSNSPGFSGSFSKSSSSSFASSSASSSSSSFSFSGAGSNVIPCLSGGCHGRNKLDSNIQGLNDHGIHGNGFNNAAAGANAVAGILIPNNNGLNEPCVGSNCNSNNGIYGKNCASGNCGPAEVTPENHPPKCTSSSCGKDTFAWSHGNSQVGFDKLANDNNVNIANKPQQPSEAIARPSYDGHGLSTNSQPQFAPASGTNFNNDQVKSSECNSPDCDLFVPRSPETKKGFEPGNKPSTYLETPYQEKACTTHDCAGSTNLNSNPGKLPSSYNVPILGVNNDNNYKPVPDCFNGNCQTSNGENKNNIQPHTVQNPKQPVESECSSGNCATPSLSTPGINAGPCTSGNCPSHIQPSYESKGVDNGLNCVSGICGSGSINPNAPSHSLKPPKPSNQDSYITHEPNSFTRPNSNHPFPSNAPTGPDANTFLQPYNPAKSNTNSVSQPNAPTGSNTISSPQPFTTSGPKSNQPLQPDSYTPNSHIDQQPNIPNKPLSSIQPPAIPMENLPYQPNSQPGAHLHPYQPQVNQVPLKSDIGSSCSSGDCNKNILLSPNNIQISNTENSASSDSSYKPSYNRPNSQTEGHQPDCGSSSCSYPTNSRPGYVTGSPTNSGTVNSKPYDSSFISSFESPKPTTDSKVLLANNGNQIYSGGFGGPVGLLSTDKKKSDSSILVNPSQSGAGSYKPPYFTNEQPNPYLLNEQKPSSIDTSLPRINGDGETQKYLQQSSAHGQSHIQPFNGAVTGFPNGYPAPNAPNGASPKNDKEKPYTGGFGGPAGLLNPNEHTLPPSAQKPSCKSGNCGGNLNSEASPFNGAVAVANADAVSYSGGFGGPPGLLKPYDSGKNDGSLHHGKHPSEQNVGGSTINNGFPHQNLNGALSGAQANAVASAATTAIDGGVGHSGGCNSGCSNKNSGAKDGLNQGGVSVANASASAKSIAGAASYAQAGSVASASAHASAGAAVKGGYKWR